MKNSSPASPVSPTSRFVLALSLSIVALLVTLAFAIQVGSAHTAQTAGKSAGPSIPAEALPPGASVQSVLQNMQQPIAMAFDPSGRLFYTERNTGRVRLYANGTLQASPVITFSVTNASEQGLLGIALDPAFTTNHYIYVYYTCGNCTPLENRVARFVEANGVGSSPTIIFRSPDDTQCGNHNGGNIHFGPDGKLYISIGDDGCTPEKAQDVTVPNGKMHRINPDGSIPPGNPVFTQTGALASLYAMGLRNSFDFAFDSLVPGRIFASENGPNCDDEMNRIEGGYNYGWRPNYPCDDANPSPQYNTIPPLWFVPSGSCCVAPTGIEVYRGSSVPQWTNDVFMCAYNNGAMYHFTLNGNRTLVSSVNTVSLGTGITCNMDVQTGPDGSLYFIQGGGYGTGTLMRIVGSNGVGTPTATRTPAPTATGTAPTATPSPSCTIQFQDVPPSSDPSSFYPYVVCLACRNIISGYQCGGPGEPCGDSGNPYFRPGARVTRGQIAKIVAQSAGFSDAAGNQLFEDVPPGSTFYAYVNRLAVHHVAGGYKCGGAGEPCVAPNNRPYFRPGANATRGQMAQIVALAAGYPNTSPVSSPTYQDVPTSNTFYAPIEQLTAHGVVSGYPCGGPGEPCVAPGNKPYFRPGANVTRAQAAKIAANTFFPNCQNP